VGNSHPGIVQGTGVVCMRVAVAGNAFAAEIEVVDLVVQWSDKTDQELHKIAVAAAVAGSCLLRQQTVGDRTVQPLLEGWPAVLQHWTGAVDNEVAGIAAGNRLDSGFPCFLAALGVRVAGLVLSAQIHIVDLSAKRPKLVAAVAGR